MEAAKCPHGMSSAAWCKKCKAELEKQQSEYDARASALIDEARSPGEQPGGFKQGMVGRLGLIPSAIQGMTGQIPDTAVESNHHSDQVLLHVPYKNNTLLLNINLSSTYSRSALQQKLGDVADPFIVAYTPSSTWDGSCPLCNSTLPEGSVVLKVLARKYMRGRWICKDCAAAAILMVAEGSIGWFKANGDQVEAATQRKQDPEGEAIKKMVEQIVDPSTPIERRTRTFKGRPRG